MLSLSHRCLLPVLGMDSARIESNRQQPRFANRLTLGIWDMDVLFNRFT